MKKLFFIFFSILLLSSCYNIHDESQNIKPDDLIDQDKIVLVLVDVELAESALRQKQNFGHEITNEKEAYYASIFKKHEVSREQFNRSMKYYETDLDAMDEIYEDVITQLSLLESEVQMEEN